MPADLITYTTREPDLERQWVMQILPTEAAPIQAICEKLEVPSDWHDVIEEG